jgi:predicted O-linked N-acetylglucosamine transferase (SPINDLY family)
MSAIKKPDASKLQRLADQAQSEGRYEEALGLAEELLLHFPANPQAQFTAAQSCLVLQRYEAALGYLDRFLRHRPQHAMARNNRGVVLEILGEYDRALKDFTYARQLEPQYEDARLNEAQCLQKLERFEDAAACYQKILRLAPGHLAAQVGLGEALRQAGRQTDAIESLKSAIKLNPTDGAAWEALGNAFLDAQNWPEAVDAYGRASDLMPSCALIYANCGKALRELGQHQDALLVTEAAISLDPQCIPALRNKVVFLLDESRWTLAVEACAAVLKVAPEDAQTFNNLGFALNALKQYEAALDAFQTAARHQPTLALAWVNRACTLEYMGRHEEALKACEEALRLDPDYPNLAGRLGHARLYVCDWAHATADRERVVQATREGKAACDPFRIISFSDQAADQQQLARKWLQASTKAVDPIKWPTIPAIKHSGKIRLGYLSADFHHHATTLLMAQMLELHDKSRFEVIAISFGPPKEDQMRARLRKAFDSFHDVMTMDDDEAAKYVRGLGLDIAVDLKGHTLDNRIGLFERRVAPVQISYLGFPGTLGAPFMDYILADHTLIPDDLKRYYDERVIRVPGTYQPNDASRSMKLPAPSRASLGLPEDAFVFCSFNNNYKITPELFDVWVRLLQSVPRSVLWLLADSETASFNLFSEAKARGVDASRLIFAPRVSWEEHLARQQAADLFLDTLPCNAHTTASDALRVGLPVLTCSGTSFASRVAASLLHAQGLDELITHDLKTYEQMALELAQDPLRMAALRSRVSVAIEAGSLFNSESLVRSIEKAYRLVFERASNEQAPSDLDV